MLHASCLMGYSVTVLSCCILAYACHVLCLYTCTHTYMNATHTHTPLVIGCRRSRRGPEKRSGKCADGGARTCTSAQQRHAGLCVLKQPCARRMCAQALRLDQVYTVDGYTDMHMRQKVRQTERSALKRPNRQARSVRPAVDLCVLIVQKTDEGLQGDRHRLPNLCHTRSVSNKNKFDKEINMRRCGGSTATTGSPPTTCLNAKYFTNKVKQTLVHTCRKKFRVCNAIFRGNVSYDRKRRRVRRLSVLRVTRSGCRSKRLCKS